MRTAAILLCLLLATPAQAIGIHLFGKKIRVSRSTSFHADPHVRGLTMRRGATISGDVNLTINVTSDQEHQRYDRRINWRRGR